ncbi:hypothetical protein SAMN06265348_105370 [Pedobacter westerhofensis]|uniref:Uncharacterized protein n=1 Tax=Pedobacter westerhofensis TaxID=425512 RepID=A0A521DGQ1_9SPHI|nr:DUF6266 family protein [Pedobacter westerhofensis]SMO70944.1 hypothetical protein SAMN06265348_105370 [Pedobacter westerhofensis]
MAVFRKGFLGGFKGKLGPGVGTTWRNLDVLKSRSTKTIEKDKLLPQNFRLDVLSRFLGPFKPFIRIGFYHKKNKDSPFNRAMHYNWHRAVKGKAPNFVIDYSKIILSRGDREPVWSGNLITVQEDQISITWEVTEAAKMRIIGNDRAIVLIYNDRAEKVQSFKTAIRSDLAVRIDLPLALRLGNSHIWMFFLSPDGRHVSNSEYIGELLSEATEI